LSRQVATLVFGSTLVVLSLSATAQDCPEPVGRWPYGVSNSVAAEGDLALLANGAALQVVDVTDPSMPAVLGELHMAQRIEAVAVSGDRGYALTYNSLHVVDLSTPAAPVLSGEFEWSDVSVLDIEMVSDHAFLAAGYDGLRVVDVSDPTTPSEIATVDLGADTYARYLDVVGGMAFVSCGGTYPDDKLFVVDVTDPEHPVIDADVLIPNGGGDIVVRDGFAYIVAYPGLHIYDVSIPQTPVWQGYATIPSIYEERLAAINDHILVTTYLRGLTVVETTDPTAPAPVGVLDAPGRSADAAYSDGMLYIAGEDRGLRMVDVSDPSQPVELGYTQVVPQAFGVAVRGDIAYVLGYSSQGLVAVDVSDPAMPAILGNAPGAAGNWITIAGDHAYIVDG